MKRLSDCFTKNPGNGIECSGVMNHYTPIDNIIINVRNFFGSWLGLIISKGEDGVSLKVYSSAFVDETTTRDILYNSSFDGRTYLAQYIFNYGLRKLVLVNLGANWIAYFMPDDMPTVAPAPTQEMKENHIKECELTSVTEGEEENKWSAFTGEVELEDHTQDEIKEIINNENKIEAATAFTELLNKKLPLPDNLYIKGTKDVDGNESIALRYKFQKPRPFGKDAEQIVSLVNIYNAGSNGIWAAAFDGTMNIPEDVIEYIKQLLEFIGANQQGGNECIYSLEVANVKDEEPEENDENPNDENPNDDEKDSEQEA